MHLPLAIAHRGASDYETENSLAAFKLASELFAEMWELDVRLSADGVAVISHDDDLIRTTGRSLSVAGASWPEIQSTPLLGGHTIPRLEDAVFLAEECGAGLYIEAKSAGAAEASRDILADRKFTFAAIGSFRADWIAGLRATDCPYPLSVLVPSGVDPFEYSAYATPDILHLCWRLAGPAPHKLVTRELIEQCELAGMAVVLWHEDRREVLDAVSGMGVLGICSNRPECLKPSRRTDSRSPALVCHRGANHLAPENTLAAARICFDQCFDYVEVDIRTTADGQLVVLHDASVDRTTRGKGAVAELPYARLRQLDAGSWFSHMFAGERVPTLGELLDLAQGSQGRAGLYIEIKDADLERVLQEVNARGMLSEVFFSCEKSATMRRMRAFTKEARLMAARWKYPSLSAAIADYNADIVEFELGVDDLSEIPVCRELGVQSMVYSTTGEWGDLKRILACKPDLANLDRPDRFKILASYPGLAARN